MALLKILEYPDPRLRRVAAPVAAVTPEIRALVRDMAETMYSAPGIGLAATQVDVHKRVIVIDIAAEDEPSQLRVFINPELLTASGEFESEEGCLSLPGYYDRVQRAEAIRVRALDQEGQRFELEANGVLAVCIQHEMDHLIGKVFVDRLSTLKRARYAARVRKKQRLAG